MSKYLRFYLILTAIIVTFQFALALGAPFGDVAMAGKYPGVMPAPMRIAAAIQGLLLLSLAGIVATRTGYIFPKWYALSRRLIWVVVGINGMATIMNLATPVMMERVLWAPVAIGLLYISLMVALKKPKTLDS